MREPKVILYYAFTPLADPEAIRLWQHTLCEQLELMGRILISRHGINGTVGGDMKNVKRYVRATKSYPGFAALDVNGQRVPATISPDSAFESAARSSPSGRPMISRSTSMVWGAAASA